MPTWDMWKVCLQIFWTIEYVKNQPTFSEIYKLHGQITQELLELWMRNSQGIDFVWTQTYTGIFKSVLVYL